MNNTPEAPLGTPIEGLPLGHESPEAWRFQEGEIFVSIASYRDLQLTATITDLLETADRPDQLRVGVCMQDTESNLLAFPFEGHPRVKVLKVSYERSEGVCFARSLIQRLLFNGEKYFMQIDSHMRFSPGWDSELKDMLGRCTSAKPLISSYPNPYSSDDEDRVYLQDTRVPRMTYKEFHPDGYMHVVGMDHADPNRPSESLWLAAGCLFTYGEWVHEVPYDPKVYFRGEEDSLLIRSYTHGWDAFAPTRNVIYHQYSDAVKRIDRPLHWEDHEVHSDFTFLHKLQAGVGIGPVRDIDDYQRHFGVNFAQQRIESRTRKGVAGEPLAKPDGEPHERSFTLSTEGIARREDYDVWVFALLTGDGEEICRDDICDEAIIGLQHNVYTIGDTEILAQEPAQYVLWPLLQDGTFLERRQEWIQWL